MQRDAYNGSRCDDQNNNDEAPWPAHCRRPPPTEKSCVTALMTEVQRTMQNVSQRLTAPTETAGKRSEVDDEITRAAGERQRYRRPAAEEEDAVESAQVKRRKLRALWTVAESATTAHYEAFVLRNGRSGDTSLRPSATSAATDNADSRPEDALHPPPRLPQVPLPVHAAPRAHVPWFRREQTVRRIWKHLGAVCVRTTEGEALFQRHGASVSEKLEARLFACSVDGPMYAIATSHLLRRIRRLEEVPATPSALLKALAS
ncbi:hypothetical protein CDCA_CDCA10G2966 [Cyanidium caldarium]|uniref:Uncharacterized protein n=1 Tax=Cyanidium caldarium TaxID=2771 RepID=A0AAV9IXT9_CYACA|nr:hypothetical protein CDCA_CDCA10G2966 [Cyanidium caldarium]